MKARKIQMACAFSAILIALLALPAVAHAQGMMIPKDPGLDPLELKSHRVDTVIKDGVGKTTVTQVFHSNCGSNIEATYIFPLPPDAAVSDFALWIGGKKKNGEVLEKDEAEKIYQQIVSKMKDPGLLDYMGGKLFRARVFPIPPNGDQQVEIAFTQALSVYQNMYKYIYPLKTSGTPVTTKEDFTFTAKIKASDPIKSIYSPTHSIDVQMNGAKEAVVGFEKNQVTLNSNFILYYNVTEDRIGLSLISHRTGKKNGTFMLMLSPGAVTEESEVIAKNVTFVLDTSGSMNGEKIKGAREALTYCLGKLGSTEKFNVIRFSSTSMLFFEQPVEATKASKEEALDKLGSINAAGGTAIESALKLALSQGDAAPSLPHFIVFITDGMPTVGSTDPGAIVQMVSDLNAKGKSKIFAFGLGEDVNANFLDMLSAKNHGASRYADSGDKLEITLERFYNAVARPAMTEVSLSFEGIGASDVFPQKMPDLFYGEQLTVAGRYAKGGKSKIILIGRINKTLKKITYSREFPDEDQENEFVEHLWATRKVGYLLDQIRLNGESQELKDEVVALARTYGIVTPYTSYLVVEDDLGPLPDGMTVTPPPNPIPFPPYPGPVYTPYTGQAGGSSPDEESSVPYTAAPSAPIAKSEAKKYGAMKSLAESAGSMSSDKAKGKEGAQMSEVLEDMKNAETEKAGLTKMVSGRLFVYRGGVWIEGAFKKDMEMLKIKFGSDAYFTLLKLKPGLKKILALGTDVIVVVGDGRAIAVLSSCDSTPDEKTIKKFIK